MWGGTCRNKQMRVVGRDPAAAAVDAVVAAPAVRYVSDSNLVLTPAGGGGSSSGSSTAQASADGVSQPDKAVGCGQAGNGLHVPAGSILCICPIESHHDARLYGDAPWAFRPDRSVVIQFSWLHTEG